VKLGDGGRVRQGAERAHLAKLGRAAGEAGRRVTLLSADIPEWYRDEGGAWGYRSGIGGAKDGSWEGPRN
jgi:hypothetical protein